MDNEVIACTSDQGVSVLKHRGLVLNPVVVSIMVLLGVSLWLLGDAPSTQTFLALLGWWGMVGGWWDKSSHHSRG